MLITKFNQLIRSRIVWASLAFIISGAFVGETVLYKMSDQQKPGIEGVLFGNDVPRESFLRARLFTLGLRQAPYGDNQEMEQLVRKHTWTRLASLHKAATLGLEAGTDAVREELRRDSRFAVNGVFSPERYHQVFAQQANISEQDFEAYLQQELTLRNLSRTVEAFSWTPPSELQKRMGDFTDTLTIDYAIIATNEMQSPVQLSDDAMRRYYADNTNTFAIPELMSVRYVTFPVSNYIDQTDVTPLDVETYYDDHIDDYTTTGTNDESVTKELAAVSNDIVQTLVWERATFRAQDAATDFVVALTPDEYSGAIPLAKVAADRHLLVSTSALFSAREIAPGMEDAGLQVAESAFSLEPEDPERYFSDAIVGTNHVYVLSWHQREAARVPAFEEVKEKVRPLALAEAEYNALQEQAKSVATGIRTAMRARKSFTDAAADAGCTRITNVQFMVYDLISSEETPEHSEALIEVAMRAKVGEVREPAVVDGGVMIACIRERKPADALLATTVRPQVLESFDRYRVTLMRDEWSRALLAEAALTDYAAQAVPADDAAPADDTATEAD